MAQPTGESPRVGLNIYSEVVRDTAGRSQVKLHIGFGPMVSTLQLSPELAERIGPTIADVLRPAIEQARRDNLGIQIARPGQLERLPNFPQNGGRP